MSEKKITASEARPGPTGTTPTAADNLSQQVREEKVIRMPLERLRPFEGQPFRVLDDELMARTVESIKSIGITSPLVVRPDADGNYEILSGHRRLHAAKLAGLEEVPVIVREMNDDEAIIFLVDSNLQRETLLPSERAKAYKMKLDAMNRQGKRSDLTSSQVGTKLRSDQIMAQELNTSRNQIQRYVRLTHLIPELQDMVDEKKIAFNPAVELSYLNQEEQHEFLDAMEYGQAAPSLSQAQRIKKLSQAGECDQDAMNRIMNEEKKGDLDPVIIRPDVLKKFFPESYTPKQMENIIIRLLEQWQRRKQRKHQEQH